jgi:hypothetical protein
MIKSWNSWWLDSCTWDKHCNCTNDARACIDINHANTQAWYEVSLWARRQRDRNTRHGNGNIVYTVHLNNNCEAHSFEGRWKFYPHIFTSSSWPHTQLLSVVFASFQYGELWPNITVVSTVPLGIPLECRLLQNIHRQVSRPEVMLQTIWILNNGISGVRICLFDAAVSAP